MTLKEAYIIMNGDYEDVMNRLAKEERIIRFLHKLENNIKYENIEKVVKANDTKKAFEETHNLKGVALNLGLTELAQCSSELCEAYRNGEPKVDVMPMLEKLKNSYAVATETIRQLEG